MGASVEANHLFDTYIAVRYAEIPKMSILA